MKHTLWYQKEAQIFEEALPLGNGSLGAMVYGGTAREKISLNLDTLWSGTPHHYRSEGAPEVFKTAQKLTLEGKIEQAEQLLIEKFHNHWTSFYLPMANLFIDRSTAEPAPYRRALDLQKAVATTQFSDTLREALVSRPHQVLAMMEQSNHPADITVSLESRWGSSFEIKGHTLLFSGQAPAVWEKKLEPVYEGGLTFTIALRIQTDGTLLPQNDCLQIRNATNYTLYLAAFCSYDTPNHRAQCLAILDEAEKTGYPDIRKAHIQDHSALFDRTALDLDASPCDLPTDARLKAENPANDRGLLELIWEYGKYLTIAASRQGTQATNLQGIWNEKPFAPWRSNYTVNINTQMNYWPTLMLGLPECHQPMIALVEKIAKTGQQTARDYYNAEGFCAHHNIDLWGHSTPVGNHQAGATCYVDWNLSSGWLCAHLFAHYEYTLDKEYLKNTAYPLMKEAANFYLSVMIFEDGEYILCPTTSPENVYIGADGKEHALVKKSTMSQAIIKELFENCVKAAEILQIDDEFCARLRGYIAKIQPHTIGADGRLLEWDEEYQETMPHHVHLSHLYGLFPGRQITLKTTPALAEAARKTLEVRGDEGTGWAVYWRAILWAKLKEGDRALKLINNQLKFTDQTEHRVPCFGGTYCNLFCAHAPFQIDGNFGVTATINHLLIQEEDGKIQCLPALPRALKNGAIRGLRLRNNITAHLTWQDHKVTELTLCSPIAQEVTVEANGEFFQRTLAPNKEISIRTAADA